MPLDLADQLLQQGDRLFETRIVACCRNGRMALADLISGAWLTPDAD